MSHRAVAFYHRREKARIAGEDLVASGIPAESVRVAEGPAEGEGRLEVQARTMDQAIDVKAFLLQDGANSVEVLLGADDVLPTDTIPHVPAA